MTDNMEIWNKLCETDPEHTQKFQRPGGFKGTAIKPMWAIKRMTEEFGPCGTGWGMYRPTFDWQDNCGLVFCTVGVWYYDAEFQETKDVYGVGGDRFTGLRANGNSFVDDEAFKKAYTDAIMNALKFIGVGADVHMGLFDDNKHVQELKERKTTDTDPKDGADLPIPRGQVTKTKDEVRESIKTDLSQAESIVAIRGIEKWYSETWQHKFNKTFNEEIEYLIAQREQELSEPKDFSKTTYCQLALSVIDESKSVKDLEQWWRDERPSREKYKLTNEDVAELAGACAVKKAELLVGAG